MSERKIENSCVLIRAALQVYQSNQSIQIAASLLPPVPFALGLYGQIQKARAGITRALCVYKD